jgi:hypothetical protein
MLKNCAQINLSPNQLSNEQYEKVILTPITSFVSYF